jgi:hypothetical protein
MSQMKCPSPLRYPRSIWTWGLVFSSLCTACGCGSSADQTTARLKEMRYTIDNLATEVAGRLKEMDRRAALQQSSPAEFPMAPLGETHRSSGPGGNPFSIEQIGEDVALKLTWVEEGPVPLALTRLTDRLKQQGVAADKIEALAAAVRESQD